MIVAENCNFRHILLLIEFFAIVRNDSLAVFQQTAAN